MEFPSIWLSHQHCIEVSKRIERTLNWNQRNHNFQKLCSNPKPQTNRTFEIHATLFWFALNRHLSSTLLPAPHNSNHRKRESATTWFIWFGKSFRWMSCNERNKIVRNWNTSHSHRNLGCILVQNLQFDCSHMRRLECDWAENKQHHFRKLSHTYILCTLYRTPSTSNEWILHIKLLFNSMWETQSIRFYSKPKQQQ